MSKILKASNFSQKDYLLDAGVLRVKDAAFNIISDIGDGSKADFNEINPLLYWEHPISPKINSIAQVMFNDGLAYYTYNGASWVYDFFDKNNISHKHNTSTSNFFYVDSLVDLPTAQSGVITLEDNYTYFFTSVVDLMGARLVCGENTTILGSSSENCRIKSTGLADPLITSQYSLPIRNITIEANVALDLNGSGSTAPAIDWFGVNFTNTPIIGTIANYTNFIMTDSAFLNSANLTFTGTLGTIGFTQCLFDGVSGQTTVIVDENAVITRRFRIIYSSFVCLAGETALDINVLASIPVEGYILDTINFSGGGTYTTGVQFNDNKSLFTNCKGIKNTAQVAYYHSLNNALVTDIITQDVAVKINAVTVSEAVSQRFTFENNKATYIGAISRDFRCYCVASVTAASSNKVIGFYFAKNGTPLSNSEMYVTTNSNNRAESIAIQTIVSLSTNDFIEVFVENATDNTDITITYLNVVIESIN